MAGVIHILPDPFAKKEENEVKFATTPGANKFDGVRRPVRGFQIKPDSYALLEVKTRNGQNLFMVDSGGSKDVGDASYSARNSNFLIQSIDEQRAEKIQMVETFGPLYLYWFGERPTMLNATGVLLNSSDFNWKNEFLTNYDTYLRGTKCAQNKTIIHFSYDDVVRTGYIQSCSISASSETNELVNFTFQMIVASCIDLSPVGYNQIPVEDIPAEPELTIIYDQTTPDTTQVPPSKLLTQLSKGVDFVQKYRDKARQFIELAENYLAGTVVRLPADLTGIGLFDTAIGPMTYTYNSPKGLKVIPVQQSKIRDDDEEYIARSVNKGESQTVTAYNPGNLSYLKGKALESKINKQLASLGIKRVPDSLVTNVAKARFAAINIGAGYIAKPN
jgi:hypothetical protein